MGFINRVRNGIKKFLTGLETQKVRQLSRENLDQMSKEELFKELERDRGEARAELQQMKRQQKSEQQEVDERQRKENISQNLQEQRKELGERKFEDSSSFSDLVQIAQKEEVEILAYKGNKSYGNLNDVLFTTDGLIGLENDGGDIVAAGKTVPDLLANPEKVGKEVQKDYITINVDERGRPIDNPKQKEVPDVMVVDGKIMETKYHTDNYMEKLAQMRTKINQLIQENAAYEKAVVDLTEEINELEEMVAISQDLEESHEKQLQRKMEQMRGIVSEYDDMENQLTKLASVSQMNEEVSKNLFAQKENWAQVYADQFDDDELDNKFDEIRKIVNLFIQNSDKLIEMSEAQQPAQPQPSPEGGESQEQEQEAGGVGGFMQG